MPKGSAPQQDYMKSAYHLFKGDKEAVCNAYAEAEKAGTVPRFRNKNNTSPEAYARALWRDGHRLRSGKTKGWIFG